MSSRSSSAPLDGSCGRLDGSAPHGFDEVLRLKSYVLGCTWAIVFAAKHWHVVHKEEVL